ncbi:MAG: glycoside hydrolase family 97 protein [Clostridium sp.]|nr:glycoside hydrolase family 97 protein [Clostridium sp.]
MKKFILALAAGACALPILAEEISSPDGRTVVDVYEKAGVPVYTVKYDGVEFIKESPLGYVLNTGDFTNGLAFEGLLQKKEVADTYSVPTIKKQNVSYKANSAMAKFSKGEERLLVEFQVSDNNVAFRYIFNHSGDPLCAVVEDEATGYVLPEETTTFLCPQMLPMSGWKRTGPSYETDYVADAPMGENGGGDGYVFPALFKVGDNGWMLLSETGLDGSYCGSHLKNVAENKYAIAFPNPAEMNGLGGEGVGIAFPARTPWRTITLGQSLTPIMETTIAYDVVKPYYEPSKEYKYGKGTWSWITRQRDSGDYAENLEFINLAQDLGYSSILIDACWDVNIGKQKIEELANIAREKGVDIFLWYNSNGYWNDAPQTPRQVMNREQSRRQEMEWMQKTGIRGIKVDFFGSDKQPMIQLYEDILKDANDYGLEVIFHGCTLPRGWERMYPNFAAAEAVRASENLYFTQYQNDIEAFSATFHPVCRNTVATMDFGGSTLNKYWNEEDKPGRGNVRRTSDVFQLATAVMFHSPVQHFAVTPQNLTNAPEWALQFMKDVPTLWDDVKFIDGYPGRYMIMARRSGDTWYIAGINAQAEPVKAKIDLTPFTDAKEISLYSDDKNLNGTLKTVKVNKKKTQDVEIPTNGAFLITAPAL